MKALAGTIAAIALGSASTFSLAATQTFNFVVDSATSTGHFNVSNDYGASCSNYGYPPCDYQFNYSFSGTLTIELTLDPALYYPGVSDGTPYSGPVYYGSVRVTNLDLTAQWTGAQPIAANPAWPSGQLPDPSLQNIQRTYDIEPIAPPGATRYFTDSRYYDFFYDDDPGHNGLLGGILDGNNSTLDGNLQCQNVEVGNCSNPFNISLKLREVPIPPSSLLFVSSLGALFYRKRRKS